MTDPGNPSGAAVLRKTVLPGGLRVVTEAIAGARSAAFGIWVAVGSRDETAGQAGAAHYLEHLLFKGTARRDALAIASAIESVGGESNAFTDKEYTCYYARVLTGDLPLAIDVTCDMLTDSLLRVADVEAERTVVSEEIAMRDDEPSDVVHELFAEALYGDHPLGRPVIGSAASLRGLTPEIIQSFYRQRYRPEAMVVAAAGGLNHDEVVQQVQTAFGGSLDDRIQPQAVRTGRKVPSISRTLVRRRRTEQVNLVVGSTGLDWQDADRWALATLMCALGGGQSSRLFQSIREQRGLAYSIYAYDSSAADTGEFGVYAGCAPDKTEQVLGLIRSGLDQVATHGLTEQEIVRAKGQLLGETVLGLEDTGSRMSRIGKAELVSGELLTVDEVLDRFASVTPDDVQEVAVNVLTRPRTLAVVGPLRRDFAGAV